MHRIASLGVLAGGMSMAAWMATGIAGAAPDTDVGHPGETDAWYASDSAYGTDPYYDLDDALQLQDGLFSTTWQVDATFDSDVLDETVRGTLYETQSLFGGYDSVLVTGENSDADGIYEQNDWGLGFTNVYFNPAGDDTDAVDYLLTPFGDVDLSWMASWFAPDTGFLEGLDGTAVESTDALSDALSDTGLYTALDLADVVQDAI